MVFKISLSKIFAYIIIFLLLLDGSAMWQLTGVIPIQASIARLLVVVFCLTATMLIKGLSISQRFIGISIFIILWLFVHILGSHYNVLLFLRNFVLVFLALYLYIYGLFKKNLIRELADAYMNVWLIIAVMTSIIWLLGSVMHVLALSPITYNWAEAIHPSYTFHNLYYENPIQNTDFFGARIARNTGIYAEAPGFSNYFLYAFGLEMAFYSNKKGHIRRVILLLLTSLTTLSTKAILFLIVIIVINYMVASQKKGTTSAKVIKIFFSLLAIVVGTYLFYSILLTKVDSMSFRIRVDDVLSSVKAWRTSPVFGVGLGNSTPIVANFNVIRSNNGLSMGLTILLAQCGVWMVSFYLIPLVLCLKLAPNIRVKKSIFLIGLAVLINLIISNVFLTPSFLIFLSAGFAYYALTNTEREQLTI